MTHHRQIEPDRVQLAQWRKFALHAVAALNSRKIEWLSPQERELCEAVALYDLEQNCGSSNTSDPAVPCYADEYYEDWRGGRCG